MLAASVEALILAGSAALCWGISDFLSRKPTEKIGYYSAAGFVQFSSFVGLFILVVASGLTTNLPLVISQNKEYFFLNVAISLINFVGITSLYRGFSKNMAIVAPIASAYPIVTISLAVLFLGSALTLLNTTGIILVILGMILTGVSFRRSKQAPLESSESRSRREEIVYQRSNASSQDDLVIIPPSRARLREGVESGLIALVTNGVVFFGLAAVSPYFGTIVPVMVLRAGGAGASFGFARVLKQGIRIPGLIVLVWIIVIASIDTLGFVAYDLASISAGPALPLVVTISGLFGAITLVLARFFYKQELERVQVAGIALLLFGVALLLYFLNH